MLCLIDSCSNASAKAGLCNAHYIRKRRHGDPLAGTRMRAKHTTPSVHLTPEYKAWDSMIYRCTVEGSELYSHYGARGISVCTEWRGSFDQFFLDMGTRPSRHHSLDRIDVNGNYEPSNCRWADKRTQSNNRRNSILIPFQGSLTPVADVARHIRMKPSTLCMRIKYGWSIEDAISKPVRTR